MDFSTCSAAPQQLVKDNISVNENSETLSTNTAERWLEPARGALIGAASTKTFQPNVFAEAKSYYVIKGPSTGGETPHHDLGGA